MSTALFFEGERARFFRPLNSSRRELVAACLRVLYDRLHGPAADYSHNLTRDALKELLLPVIREHQGRVEEVQEPDEFSEATTSDPEQLANLIVRVLTRDGWLEQFPDRHGLVTAFRLTRPGKLFAHAFWSLTRPSRTRQQNMRSCRNALEAALHAKGTAEDLLDAYEHAENVIEDLTEGIDLLQERIRILMREASLHNQWEDFVEFLDKFQRSYSKQFTVDSATLNKNAIRNRLDALRTQLDEDRRRRMEDDLREAAGWAVKECSGQSVFEWLLDRIEEVVAAAHESKQPGFMRAMNTYIKRITGLVQQSMMLRTGQDRHAYMAAVTKVASLQAADQDVLLERIGRQLSPAEVRLLDPASFKLRTARQRKSASTVSVPPRASREARLAAALKAAEENAFSVANTDLVQDMRKRLRLFRHPVRVSALPLESATAVLGAMQVVEALRSEDDSEMVVRRLPGKVENEFFTGPDYEVTLRRST
ncbi:MAG: ferrochelatase [Burkholderiales bacterium]|nr:MAG: ferrochelatase [Burkholderiales bacterium]